MNLRHFLAFTSLSSCSLALMAQPLNLCTILPQKDIAAASKAVVGQLTSDGPAATLSQKQVPGLPATIQLEQCNTPFRASGAVPLRVGLMTATRAMTAADWLQVIKAFDDGNVASPPPKRIADVTRQCWKHSWSQTEKNSKALNYETACSATKGKRHMTIAFEHEDPKQLPSESAVAELLNKALQSLPP